MAKTTFSGPVHSLNGFIGPMQSDGPLRLTTYTVGELPDPLDHPGAIAIASDANNGTGVGSIVFAVGNRWVDATTGDDVTDT